MSDAIPRISKVINPLMTKHKMRARFPLPVWDDTGTLLGVSIQTDKKMGPQDCVAEASFTLSPAEIANPERLKEKAELAVQAIKLEVWVSIRQKRKEKAS